jgi:hypothetical protein
VLKAKRNIADTAAVLNLWPVEQKDKIITEGKELLNELWESRRRNGTYTGSACGRIQACATDMRRLVQRNEAMLEWRRERWKKARVKGRKERQKQTTHERKKMNWNRGKNYESLRGKLVGTLKQMQNVRCSELQISPCRVIVSRDRIVTFFLEWARCHCL